MDLKKLREILKIVAESDVAEVEIDEDGVKVTIRKEAPTVTLQPPGYYPPPPYYPPYPAQAVPGQPQLPLQPQPDAQDSAAASQPAPENETIVRAPIVGTYFEAPSPDSDAYVKVGSSVTEGTVLCIIEAMKLMNEIECEVAGTIKQMLVKDGEPVEYDQPLFVIETA